LSVMPYFCSAYGCNNKDSEDARRQGITFHKLVYIFDIYKRVLASTGWREGWRPFRQGTFSSVQEPSVVRDRDRRPL